MDASHSDLEAIRQLLSDLTRRVYRIELKLGLEDASPSPDPVKAREPVSKPGAAPASQPTSSATGSATAGLGTHATTHSVAATLHARAPSRVP